MWPGEAVAAAAAFCGGAVVATALAAFIIELGIIPRFAGITHTANHILLYETCLMLGSFLGNLVSVYEFSLPFGKIFLGIMALGEVVNVFAIMSRRLGLKKGTALIILSIALGKILGSLLQFFLWK